MRIALPLAVLAAAATAGLASAQSPPPDPPPYNNPVMAGDYPDPTVLRVGPEYWAITTASSGRTLPPILRSPDLVNWSEAGYLLLSPPEWSSGRQLWAPSLERDGERFLVYYSARRRSGRPCVTVAESLNVIGPYVDRGPLVCQRGGSIDPTLVRNPNGRPFLVWKENGGDRPSTLWVRPLTRDLLRLTGTPRRIMRGDPRSWEGGLIEAPDVVRRRGVYYLFYSGGRCCAPPTCRYAMGVARARSIYGPWRRNERNPIMRSDRYWLCPGHGSVVQTGSGRWWMVYHGYRRVPSLRRGREMLLDVIRWSRSGWPSMRRGARPR